ncbi:MAG: hypothetical protein LBQ48_05795, partial [Oscillospiraceae bacterium]|nr:hypothetical protein [Oscillospiraceae bacterium]
MKRHTMKKMLTGAVCVSLALLILWLSPFGAADAFSLIQSAALYSAGGVLGGGGFYFGTKQPAERTSQPTTDVPSEEHDQLPETGQPASGDDATSETAAPAPAPASELPEGVGSIKTETYGARSASFSWQNVMVSNKTTKPDFDIEALLKLRPDIKII